MTLGRTVRQLREQNNLSLRDFAKAVGCSAAFVSDIELGRRNPSNGVVVAMARVLQTTAVKLKEHDTRLPVEALKAKIAADPRFAYAFRVIAESKVSPDELIAFVEAHMGHSCEVRKRE